MSEIRYVVLIPHKNFREPLTEGEQLAFRCDSCKQWEGCDCTSSTFTSALTLGWDGEPCEEGMGQLLSCWSVPSLMRGTTPMDSLSYAVGLWLGGSNAGRAWLPGTLVYLDENKKEVSVGG